MKCVFGEQAGHKYLKHVIEVILVTEDDQEFVILTQKFLGP